MSNLRLLLSIAGRRAPTLPPSRLYRQTRLLSISEAEMAPTWQEEKKRYLSMTLEEKRLEYLCGHEFCTLGSIKAWHDFMYDNRPIAQKIPLLPNHKIDAHMNEELCKKVSIFRGDITTLEVDAIVNAANKSLLGGGGVDGAIHRAAGPFLLEENKTLGGCEVGDVRISGGYKLPAKYVISTVGPQGERPDKLTMCYKNSMDLLLHKQLHTIAFPCISTGIYGYPLKPAAHIAAMTVRRHLEEYPDHIDRVIFCLFTEMDEEIYQGILQSYFPLK